VLKFDLAEEIDALHHEEGWRTKGHSAKTLAKHRDMTIVLVAMKRNTRMKEHRTDGAVSIQVLEGHLQVHVGRKTVDLGPGSLLAIDRASHDVEALDHSVFLLSVGAGSPDDQS
jgi:quercetin dioxygenase-like cupin family protein